MRGQPITHASRPLRQIRPVAARRLARSWWWRWRWPPRAPTAAGDASPSRSLPTKDPCGSCDRPRGPGTRRAAEPAGAARAGGQRSGSTTCGSTARRRSAARSCRRITQPYIGRDVTLADLESLAQAITARYRERGYFLAQAVVPVQTVQRRRGRDQRHRRPARQGRRGGRARCAHQRGARARLPRAGAVRARRSTRSATSAPCCCCRTSPAFASPPACRKARSPAPPTSSVEVAAGPRWAFSAEADNHGTKESGRYRVGGTARWLSPVGIGDNLDCARPGLGRNGAAVRPRSPTRRRSAASGLRAGIGLARVSYELGGQFADLDAQGTRRRVRRLAQLPADPPAPAEPVPAPVGRLEEARRRIRGGELHRRQARARPRPGLDLGAARRVAGRRLLGQLGHALPRQARHPRSRRPWPFDQGSAGIAPRAASPS